MDGLLVTIEAHKLVLSRPTTDREVVLEVSYVALCAALRADFVGEGG